MFYAVCVLIFLYFSGSFLFHISLFIYLCTSNYISYISDVTLHVIVVVLIVSLALVLLLGRFFSWSEVEVSSIIDN